ncbi:MAG: sulfatase-like hydrolase/transferase, partial [Ardenticatenaceae bacterium]
YSDDQRWDTMCLELNAAGYVGPCEHADGPPMPFMRSLLTQSVVFTNSFVSYPLCCPSRVSLLKGGLYAHHTGIMGNSPPHGGALRFSEVDTPTIATRLQQVTPTAYATAMIGGKYLNHYAEQQVDFNQGTAYVPPGWDYFAVTADIRYGPQYTDSFGVVVAEAGVVEQVEYLTNTRLFDWELTHLNAFLDTVCDDCNGTPSQPFFLLYSTYAPHISARFKISGTTYANLYAGYHYTGRAWNEADPSDGETASDKPFNVTEEAEAFEDDEDLRLEIQGYARSQLQMLQALDDNLETFIGTLETKGLLENTIILFASDNGMLWGEHGLAHKNRAYEEALRVPLFTYNPVDEWAHEVITEVVAVDLDLAPTILDLAGAVPLPSDGRSLVELVGDVGGPWRSEFLIQGNYDLYVATAKHPQAWVGLRTQNCKVVWTITGERELYPYTDTLSTWERRNLADQPELCGFSESELDQTLTEFAPPMAITTYGLPHSYINLVEKGYLNQTYDPDGFVFTAWKGEPPYEWRLYDGQPACLAGLPDGMYISGNTLAGTPSESGLFTFCVEVTDEAGAHDWRMFRIGILPAP